MDDFFDFMKLTVITIASLTALVFILLSIPQSRLRKFMLTAIGWGLSAFAGLCVIYIVSPIDLIPDFIPVLGQVDDAAALVSALFTGIAGVILAVQGRDQRGVTPRAIKRVNLEESHDNLPNSGRNREIEG